MGIDKVDPQDPGGRPIPDKPRDRDDNNKIYALLVGVDDYQGDVNSLSGCVADIEAVAGFLRGKYGKDAEGNDIESVFSPLDGDRADDDIQVESVGRLHICSLKDEAATYDNVIRGFREFLVNDGATADASFWFHFSGHGTERFTAREFYRPEVNGVSLPALEPNGKDQCLVLFNEGGGLDGALLADKELAVLIAGVYESARSLNENHKPHIVLTIDCCHAGTATRGEDDDFMIRKIQNGVVGSRDWEDADDHDIPAIGDYLDGHYNRLMGEGEERSPANLFIPQAPHMVISGAHALEKAGDTADGGFFTKSLIDILSKPNVGFNYVDLFNQTRNKVKILNRKQTPQLESINSFNPYTRFLEGWEDQGNIGLYPVRVNSRGTFYVRCGAINGLPTDTDEEIQVIVRDAVSREALGNAFIARVGVQDSRLELGFALIEQETVVVGNPNKILDPSLLPSQNGEAEGVPRLELDTSGDTAYVAQLYKIPFDNYMIKDSIGLEAKIAGLEEDEHKEELQQILGELANINIHLSANAEETADAKIEITESSDEDNDLIHLNDHEAELDQHSIPRTKNSNSERLYKSLKKMLQVVDSAVHWKRWLALENSTTKLNSYFSAELEIIDKDATEVDADSATGVGSEFAQTTFMPFGDASISKAANLFFDEAEQLSDEELEMFEAEGFVPVKYLNMRLKLNFKDKKNTDNLYFYLFNMMEDGAIQMAGVNEFRIENTSNQDVAHYPFYPKGEEELAEDQSPFIQEMVMPDDTQQEIFLFKLLVTKQQIDVIPLLQEGFDSTRGTLGRNRVSSLRNDWCFLTMKLRINRS